MFHGAIVSETRNPDGTFTVVFADGTTLDNVIMTDNGGNSGTLGTSNAGTNQAAETVAGAWNHATGTANSMFNPFQTIIDSLTQDNPETHQLRANARKFGFVSILLAFALLFTYIIFKD